MNQESRLAASVGLLLVTMLSSSAALGQAAAAAADAAAPTASATASAATVPGASALYASVNGKPVTRAEFLAAFSTHMRQKFYHGQVPEDQLLSAQKEVSDQIINRMLFLEEVERRHIEPDIADVERQIASYDQRYAGNAGWQKSREAMLPGLRAKLNEQSQLARLEQTVRDVPVPGVDEVKAFYAAKPELFTEPEKMRLRSILLAVDPSASRSAWEAATREAEAIVRRIRGGADFAEQARLSSNDASAENGGDMGYLHAGMLSESLQAKVSEFKVGEVADPIETLQGVVIVRLEDRTPAKLQPFERVAERARDLLLREKKELAWQSFVAKLRSAATVVVYETPAAPATAVR
jgi:parvulin-like peptidyl-prolyl isomerase